MVFIFCYAALNVLKFVNIKGLAAVDMDIGLNKVTGATLLVAIGMKALWNNYIFF